MSKPLRAWSLIRSQPCYRAEAFLQGLKVAGYAALPGLPAFPIIPGEVLVIWNRYGDLERLANRFEAAGGVVLVAENGYFGMDRDNRQRYAISRHAHNGRGTWWPRGPERFEQLCAELQRQPAPPRTHGDYVLVAPNRSFGMAGGIMPHDWAERTAALIRADGEKVRIRHHPGNCKSDVPLVADLARARRVVIWSSSVGVEALMQGLHVECHAPWWICKHWEVHGRHWALARMAWAQWSVAEIDNGTAFHHLLRPTGEAQVAAGA